MPALSVSNLTMTFIERNLFTDVSFEVESRDKVGFIDVYKRQTVSGITTTGATILNDLEALSKGMLMWRSCLLYTSFS